MLAEIVDFKGSGRSGDGRVYDCDQILEKAAGIFEQVVVLGFNKSGGFQVHSSHGSRDALWAIQRAIHHLLFETE